MHVLLGIDGPSPWANVCVYMYLKHVLCVESEMLFNMREDGRKNMTIKTTWVTNFQNLGVSKYLLQKTVISGLI